MDTVVGVDFEQHLIFALDRKKNLFGLDLDSRKTRTYLPQTRAAVLGPDATLYAVDTGGTVVQISRRAVRRFPGHLAVVPAGMFATTGGDLLATEPAGGRLAVRGSDASRSLALPHGPVAVTFWGDLVAVGTDSGVVLLDPQGKRTSVTVGHVGKVRAVLFSPSGHRVYAANEQGELVVIDRFGHGVLKKIPLPAPATALRTDFFGNWLLARGSRADSVWVIDLDSERIVGGTVAPWGADLPVVAAPHTLIVRRGKDVVALDISGSGLRETGKVAGGAEDLWLPIVWSPPAPEAPAAADATTDTARVVTPMIPVPPDSARATGRDSSAAPPGTLLYLQVSSSRNPTWASDLAGKLRAAGLQPTVLKPAQADESYRVVLGPFRTREDAEETGRKLGMPSFVITAQGDSGR